MVWEVRRVGKVSVEVVNEKRTRVDALEATVPTGDMYDGSKRTHLSVSPFFSLLHAEDGIRDTSVTGVQTCALPIWRGRLRVRAARRPGGRLRARRAAIASARAA